jgi:hypothetical protein
MIIAIFAWAMAIMYGLWSHIETGRIEVAGFVALILSGGLLATSGTFFGFVARRIDPRPEDRSDAEIAEGAGELGFFSPSSYWPLGIALSATVTAIGLAFVEAWLAITGGFLIMLSAAGLLFEYYTGGRRPSP